MFIHMFFKDFQGFQKWELSSGGLDTTRDSCRPCHNPLCNTMGDVQWKNVSGCSGCLCYPCFPLGNPPGTTFTLERTHRGGVWLPGVATSVGLREKLCAGPSAVPSMMR